MVCLVEENALVLCSLCNLLELMDGKDQKNFRRFGFINLKTSGDHLLASLFSWVSHLPMFQGCNFQEWFFEWDQIVFSQGAEGFLVSYERAVFLRHPSSFVLFFSNFNRFILSVFLFYFIKRAMGDPTMCVIFVGMMSHHIE